MDKDNRKNIIIIGGGIAATSCLQSLYQSFETWPQQSRISFSIILICPKTRLKLTENLRVRGRRLESFDVIESYFQPLLNEAPVGLDVTFIHGFVISIDAENSCFTYFSHKDPEQKNHSIRYTKLCICTGAVPNDFTVSRVDKKLEPYLVKIRDYDSVVNLQNRLRNARKVLIVGNGGIGLETVFKISNCRKVWIIKDSSIGTTFFDAGAARYLLEAHTSTSGKKDPKDPTERQVITQDGGDMKGCSLGPHWSKDFSLRGSVDDSTDLRVIYEDEIETMEYLEQSLTKKVGVTTRKGLYIDCDIVVLALGVVPNTDILKDQKVNLSDDKGILIDTNMRSSVKNIYAAGDVVSCDLWPIEDNLWFQMRLWTQARQMGFCSAKCIIADLENSDPSLYFNFDCFCHVTEFFNQKVVLLGKFKSDQALNCDGIEVLLRINPPNDYIKLIMDKTSGRITGAVLIGNSGLEETIENLIHDQIDVRNMKEKLLDNSVDIEDYFD